MNPQEVLAELRQVKQRATTPKVSHFSIVAFSVLFGFSLWAVFMHYWWFSTIGLVALIAVGWAEWARGRGVVRDSLRQPVKDIPTGSAWSAFIPVAVIFLSPVIPENETAALVVGIAAAVILYVLIRARPEFWFGRSHV